MKGSVTLDQEIINNSNTGLRINGGREYLILENTISKDGRGNGIYLYNFNGSIVSNLVHNHSIGIQFYSSDKCILLGNNISNNNYGISISNSDFNNITHNIIEYNSEAGLSLSDFDTGCNFNDIYDNFFIKNKVHAVDEGVANKWNSTKIGNFWDNYTGKDIDNNGIGDIWHIFNNGGSIDKLPIWENLVPTITIIFPNSSSEFGRDPPVFEVLVVDNYPETVWYPNTIGTMWYTLDGGISNHIFTSNGIINQTAWNALSNGNIKIEFYAEDIAGNVGYNSIVVIKNVPLGIDNWFIIIILIIAIVSIISLLILFVLLKKKKSLEVTQKQLKLEIEGMVPPTKTEKILFLSYSTLDTDHFQIKTIVEKLKAFPEIDKVFFWEVDSGENIVEYMERTLKICSVFVLFCSKNSLNSKSVTDEWQAAFQLRKKELLKIIPVYEDESYIPVLLTPLLNVKFSNDNFIDFIVKLYKEILRE